MTTMQNHFISRDTQNNWDVGSCITQTPCMAVMATGRLDVTMLQAQHSKIQSL